METDPTRMCELLVGLPDVNVEGVGDLIKSVKRVAFGITNWTNYRTRSLRYAGRPDWSLLNLNPR